MPRCNIPQKYAFFADEAGISQDRFTVVGGCCLTSAMAEEVYASIEKYRNDFNMHSELKWSKISNQKVQEYEAFVELFFALNSTNHIQFHSVIFDSHQWDHKSYNNGDRDVGLSKLYYQLILQKFIKRCGKEGDLFACLDRRNSSTSLNELREMLNAGENQSGLSNRPLKQLISKDSKLDDILQLNDVILGAVCAIRNGRHLLAGGREAKKVIARKVLSNSGLQKFASDSPSGVHRFTVWNFKARERKR